MKNLRHLLRRSGWLSPEKRRRRLDRSRNGVTRRLSNESLEKRQLLAGDFALAHNYWEAHDVDDNRAISAKDALTVINHLNRNGGGQEITDAEQVTSFVDVNADHHVTAVDALSVINALNRGETEVGDRIELMLTARDQNDDPIAPNADGDVPVNVGEIFNLEVSYRDLRGFSGTGAFRVAADIAFDPSSPITPALTETQQLFFDAAIVEESGTISFSLEGDPSTTVDVNIADFTSSTANAANEVESALVQLGYSPDQVEASAKLTRLAPGSGEKDTVLVEIRYLGNDLVNDDLPGLMAEVNATNPVTVNTVEIDPFNPDGTVNGKAIPFNLILESRTFGGEPYYNSRVFGSYIDGTGFDEVGGLGQVPSQGGGIPEVNNGEFEQPFDAFSVPIIVTEPVTGLIASLNPPDVGDGILLYGTEEGDEQVPPEMILLDEDSRVSITATQGITAGDGVLSVTEDATTAETIDLSDLVTITSGGAASFAIATEPSKGSASLSGSVLSYTPDADEFGSDTIVYTATNADGSTSGTIDVTIDPVNDAPVAVNDTATTEEDIAVTIDVLSNDETGAANEDDELSVQDATDGADGTTTINADGTITYVPDTDFFGTDSFTYTVFDGTDTAQATVNITVTEAPESVAAGNGALETAEDATTPVTIDLSTLVTVISGDAPTFSIQTNGSLGNATLTGSILSYTPDADEFGSDTVVYTATNNEGSDSGTISVSISADNDAPVANDDTAGTSEGTAINVPVLNNDSTGADNEDDVLSVASVTAGANGTTSVNADGTIRYTPDPNFNGTDEFTYTINDGTDTSASATVTISVTAVNDPPVANPDSASTDEDESVAIDVLENDTTGGPDELDTLTVVDAADGANGTTTVESDGSITYIPADDFNGTDTFTYTLSDGTNTTQGTVTVTVNSVNDAPVANDDTTSTVKNNSVVIDVLSNDNVGADNEVDDVLTITATADPAQGAITVNGDGTITYSPATDFLGTETFTYTVSDGTDTAQATVSVTVRDFEPSTLSGSVFFDHVENIDQVISNGADPIRNGVKEDDESGLSGTPVRLVSPADENISGERVELTTFTKLDGSYEFEDVVPGNYQIVYDIPEAVLYGRDIGDLRGNPVDDGVVELTIGEDGGVVRNALNFTLLSTRGSSINNIDLLASTYANNTDGVRHGGTVSLNEDGTQNWLKAEEGFDGVLFAELTFNQKRDAALLTIVEEDGSVRTASLTEEQFIVSSDGTAAAFFGGRSDFDFVDAEADLIREEFENYRKTIDEILAQFGETT